MRLFALAFVLGTVALQHQEALPTLPFGLAGMAALLAAALVPARQAALRALVLVVAGALAGFGWAAWSAEVRMGEALPAPWEGRDIEVSGRIATLPHRSAQATRFLFHVEETLTAGAHVPRTVAASWYAERESAPAAAPPELRAGERWRLTLRLKRPRGLANPHGFAFEPWALQRGIRATGYVRARAGAQRLDPGVGGGMYAVHRLRGAIRDAMLAHLGEARLGGVLVALAIGEQDAIAAEDWRIFWRTGVGHLMSISGLHITMLAALAFAAVFFAWVRAPALALRFPARKAAALAGAAAAFAYALLTGFAIPAQRTFIMLMAVAACVLADRHGSPSRVLALAALAVTAADPWAGLSAGFWLSFGAVAAIFYVMALRTGSRGRVRRAILEQLAVTVAMIPMLLALFQEFPLVSPLANAFAIPLVSLAVVPLTLAGAFSGFGPLLDGAHALMQALMVLLEALAALPFGVLENPAPRPWTVAAAAIGGLWLLAPRGVPMRAAGLAWMVPLFAVLPPSPRQGEAWVHLLDVGHGLAVVVRTAGHALLYDTGAFWSAESDSGARVVVPFLRGEGIRPLDGIVVSHADDDHSGGAASIAQARNPGWLLSSLEPDDALHARFPASMRCEAGQRWRWDGVELAMLHPAAPAYLESARRRNDLSCVLRISTRAASLLLTGDAEARSEAELLERGAAGLRSDVLLVPHHGSKSSSTPAFLDAVGPRLGIVSLGYRNRFRHPHPAVLDRYAERGVTLARTDRDGAITVRLGRESSQAIEVEAHARKARYWSERRGGP